MADFAGFDVSGVERIEVRSYTIGPGRSAELVAITLDVYRRGANAPEVVEVEFPPSKGPTLAQMEALVRAVNRRSRREPGG